MCKICWLLGFFFVVFPFRVAASGCGKWSWLHRKKFNDQQVRNNARKASIPFERYDVPRFSQLVFSWNAFRPKSGYLSFSARVRDARTKKWSPWYKMMEWGAGIQRSYASSSRGNTRYVHVRLETGRTNLADAFRIKITPHKGASLAGVKALSVCTANFNQFKKEKITKALLRLPSVHVRNVPKKSQRVLNHARSDHMCSPTSCSMLTSFFIKRDIDPLDFAKKAFDEGLNAYGSWPFNVAHAFERCAGAVLFSTMRLHSFKTLHQQLMRQIPTVVSVRGFLRGAPQSYDKGHLLLVVGWDAQRKQVICHDPALGADRKTLKRYGIESFLSAWERSHRLAYLAEPSSTRAGG